MNGIALRDNQSAMALLHDTTTAAVHAFPHTFADLEWTLDRARFRHRYPDLLAQFEAARIASDERLAIAQKVVSASKTQIVWQQDESQLDLASALRDAKRPFELKHHTFGNSSAWLPSLVYRGERHTGAEIKSLATRMCDDLLITQSAEQALHWLFDRNETIDFRQRKFVMLGAGAEMAPTKQWLTAGAQVLWLDTQPPPPDWFETDTLGGQLYWVEDGVNLLTAPGRIKATIESFAAGEQIDLGLYAYAPGQARELKLATVMNAIVENLPAELIASVTLLVSPTTPTRLSPEDMVSRLQPKGWQRFFSALRLLDDTGGYAKAGSAAATRTVVSIQGASYQAAQYLAKVLTAECWAAAGLRVSANTAAITRTRSLAHPVFTAAFGGARAFGVQTLTPRQSRTLNGLLAAHDWLIPELPIPGRVRVHGGIHSLAYPLDSALRIAAAIGFIKSPRLLAGLFRR